MFTIRVNHSDGTYDVQACVSYKVRPDKELGQSVVAMTQESSDGSLRERPMHVEAGERAYVMNARGETVDTIWPAPKQAEAAR